MAKNNITEQSPEHIAKRMESRKNNPFDLGKKSGALNRKASNYRITLDTGEVIEHKSLADYAKLNNLSGGALHGVMTGKNKRHKNVIKVEKLD